MAPTTPTQDDLKNLHPNGTLYEAQDTSIDQDDIVHPPPDGGWGWVVVFAAFMVNLIADGVSLSFGVLFIDFVEYFGASKAKTSWVGSIFLSMPLLAGPVASYLIDRYGCRKMCILGSLLATASFFVSIYAASLEFLFLTFSVAGLGLALCYVTSIVIVAYYFEKRRSLATGLAACGTGIGTFVFPPFTIYLLKEYGWQGTLLILSGCFLNMVVFGALMRDLDEPPGTLMHREEPQTPTLGGNSPREERLCSSMLQLPTYLDPIEITRVVEKHPRIGEKEPRDRNANRKVLPLHNQPSPPPIETSGKLDAAYLRNMKIQRGSITYRGAMLNIHRYRLKASSCPDIFRNSMVTISDEKSCQFLRDLRVLILQMFDVSIFRDVGYTLFCVSNFLLYICLDVPYVYVPDHACTTGTDLQSASILVSILGAFNCLGVVFVGYIGDKPWIDPSLLYSGFISLSGVSLILLPFLANYYATATLVGIYGFMISANYTLVPIIIVHLISLDSFTGAYGLLLLVQGIASLIGPPAAGALFDMTGNYDITFYFTGLLIILSGILVIPVANSLLCRSKSSVSNSDKDISTPPETKKVKFQSPPAVEPKNTDPLLPSGDTSAVAIRSQSVTLYENPLAQDPQFVHQEV